MSAFLTRIAADRAKGNSQPPMRSLAAAALVGAAAAGFTYRVLRS
jgi:hypothetical protein